MVKSLSEVYGSKEQAAQMEISIHEDNALLAQTYYSAPVPVYCSNGITVTVRGASRHYLP